MVHVGLDLSRTRLDVHVMNEAGTALAVTTAVPDSGGLAALADRISGFGGPVYAAIESMNGARFVHDQLEMAGWQVEIADAQKVKGLAPLACKTDKIDSWVLAELSRRDLVPAIWLPTPSVRAERERARWRLHLVRHRTALKNAGAGLAGRVGRRPVVMVHVGLDLSRTRLDVHVMNEAGTALAVTTAVPDSGGLAVLADRISGFGGPVYAAIESMNGARFVHDQLEMAGWQVEIADAQKVKGLAPLACKTDKIDSWVLAELSRRDLVPAIWLPTPSVRAERERARWRLHLVRHRTALKNRIHATLLAFGHPCPVSDLFGVGGRELLARLALPNRGPPTPPPRCI